MKTLDRALPIPLYHQLKQNLLTSLENGEFEPNVPLPTEISLIERHRVSRITVRRAMQELEQEGLIYRIPGKGTFITEPKIYRESTHLTSFTEDMQGKKLAVSSELLDFRQVAASEYVAAKLGVERETAVTFIQRLRLEKEQPIALNYSYIRLPPHISITAQELEAIGSLWALLENKGIVLAEADREIEAVLADQEQADFLQVAVNAPLLLVEGVVFDQAHTPVEYHQVINRGDRYKYMLHLKR